MFHVRASRDARPSSVSNRHPFVSFDVQATNGNAVPHTHIAILGAGFSGLGIAIKLKKHGYDDFIIIERAKDIGGTWRDNTYPGCACDIPSLLYSFSFAPNPNWSRLYPQQKEIQSYLRRCARRFGLLPHIRWHSELVEAAWNEDEQRWHITTTQEHFTSDIFICGNGPLNEPSLPAISGIEQFEGTIFHSSQWRHDYDLTGKHVAVIGTGASAIQFVPQIQPKVAQLTVFQRTPPWIVPRLDHPIPYWQQRLFRLLPVAQRLVRARIYLRNELTALGLVYRPEVMKEGMRFAQEHLARQVPDPLLREKLTPHYMMGCKRILVSDDFYPSLGQPNVELVTEPIREIKAHSVVTADGREHEVDTIICGTGFHVTDAPFPQHVRGRHNQTLAEKWNASPTAYLGTTIADFPNLFLLIGPYTGLGHNSMIYMIESQINYILDCLRKMERYRVQSVEIQPEAQAAFDDEMQRRLQGTAWTSGCVSWYLTSSGRNTTIWPGFTFEFRYRTRRFDWQHYSHVARHNAVPSPSSS
ncbi:flavin-containing monooxygenase [Dictyobacter formicarum]|uniref:4-hydroxyacetophenone monooxygenase n=1 Tax=Dictyobacter formicarum TaxID=2778368 RepID=A0ABQ3VTP8_9CHLR|nr:NAD(P)/FAD-dependent oxidoreductase [Dictyobacter formicarum]GHO88486.1 4-hydroxyacetophenone monooxygenase [Dictyobacter formicarum]